LCMWRTVIVRPFSEPPWIFRKYPVMRHILESEASPAVIAVPEMVVEFAITFP